MKVDHFATFLEECRELVADLESALVELEERPTDGELVGRVFRALHTIKGSAGMFGLDCLAVFVHRIESLFDLVRCDEVKVTGAVVDAGLKATDLIARMVENPDAEIAVPDELLSAIAMLMAEAVTVDCALPLKQSGVDAAGYANILTEYELSRVKAIAKRGGPIYIFKVFLHLENLSQELAVFAKKIGASGELLSTIPLSEAAPPGMIGFTILFTSSETLRHLEAELEAVPLLINPATLIVGMESCEPLPESRELATYRIRFSPRPESLVSGVNPLDMINELKLLGECIVVAQTRKIPDLEELKPDECYLFWDIILTTECSADELRDIFIFIEEGSEVSIERISDDLDGGGSSYKKLGEILVERGDISSAELDGYLGIQKPLGQILVEAEAVSPRVIESALIEQSYMKGIMGERQKKESSQSIRVSAEKLDLLVNLAGEMVTIQARLTQCAQKSADPALTLIAEEVERLTDELRDTALNMRMLPIGTTFSRFKRVVRDLGEELGKRVQLIVSGGETELDKTVIEKLNDPLVHLIRNSIDHGIESIEERRASGKPVIGTVQLSATHAGDSVLVTISDDGRGLDYEAIRKKAVEKGLVAGSTELTDREIGSFIFLPGFTTAARLSDISGRGVGMDVVKRSIDSLRGRIEMSSQKGEGTEIVIRIPLTLVIIESLLVKVAEERFVLPLAMVEECVELVTAGGGVGHGNLLDVRGQLVPYLHLRQRFGIEGAPPEIQQVVIINHGGRRAGVAVDHVIGQHQAVIKPLGQLYGAVDDVSGATILGDGAVALIVDVPKMMEKAETV